MATCHSNELYFARCIFRYHHIYLRMFTGLVVLTIYRYLLFSTRPSKVEPPNFSQRETMKMPCPSLSIVDQAFSIWYHHSIQDTGYYLWRMLPRAASSERRWRDDQKRTPRHIDTQHEGMELHRGCPGNVDAELAFRVILFSIARKRILLSISISHVSARMVLPSTYLPLVLVLPVARILTHSAPLVCF